MVVFLDGMPTSIKEALKIAVSACHECVRQITSQGFISMVWCCIIFAIIYKQACHIMDFSYAIRIFGRSYCIFFVSNGKM